MRYAEAGEAACSRWTQMPLQCENLFSVRTVFLNGAYSRERDRGKVFIELFPLPRTVVAEH